MRRQKNDGNDAEAICTSARQAHISLVPNKTVEQQDIQGLHCARQRMVSRRTAVVSAKTATAIVAAIGDGAEFKNGRHLAAWVGLVPRQFLSGDHKLLMGISKRGNQNLRSLLPRRPHRRADGAEQNRP